MRRHILPSAALALLMSTSLGSAKTVTINEITVDLPDAFTATDYTRGMETKTSDEEVFVWFETYKDQEFKTIAAEHEKYWDENDVVLNAPSEQKDDSGPIQKEIYVYNKATWKGKPTVLKYFRQGPYGSQDVRIFITLWASPEGFEEHKAEVQGMFDSLKFTYRK